MADFVWLSNTHIFSAEKRAEIIQNTWSEKNRPSPEKLDELLFRAGQEVQMWEARKEIFETPQTAIDKAAVEISKQAECLLDAIKNLDSATSYRVGAMLSENLILDQSEDKAWRLKMHQLLIKPPRSKDRQNRARQAYSLANTQFLLERLIKAADSARSHEMNKTGKHTEPARALVYALARVWRLTLLKNPTTSKKSSFWCFCDSIAPDLNTQISERPFTETVKGHNAHHPD